MECPNCHAGMQLLRTDYDQVHDDEDCEFETSHIPPEGSEFAGNPSCVHVYDEYHCEPCQIGVHPDKGSKQ